MKQLYGLVLAGGKSQRMGRDKALLRYGQEPQLERAVDLLRSCVDRVFVSVRTDQRREGLRSQYDQIVDGDLGQGPAAGLIAAHRAYDDVAWLCIACDLPLLRRDSLLRLIDARHPQYCAIAYLSQYDGLPEPLCALWEPKALAALVLNAQNGDSRPRSILDRQDICRLINSENDTMNVNTPKERKLALKIKKLRR